MWSIPFDAFVPRSDSNIYSRFVPPWLCAITYLWFKFFSLSAGDEFVNRTRPLNRPSVRRTILYQEFTYLLGSLPTWLGFLLSTTFFGGDVKRRPRLCNVSSMDADIMRIQTTDLTNDRFENIDFNNVLDSDKFHQKCILNNFFSKILIWSYAHFIFIIIFNSYTLF